MPVEQHVVNTPTSSLPRKSLPGAPLADLSPAYFGLVMATGIISIGAHRLGFPQLARILFGLNLFLYAIVWLLYGLRLLRHPAQMTADFCSHEKGTGFFTLVAATGIIGSQFLLIGERLQIAIAFLFAAILFVILLTYSIFTIFTIKAHKPTLDRGINGGWLLAVVATQSIAVLAALIAARSGHNWHLQLNFLALSTWLFGGMLYIWMMSLIFYRYTFFEFHADDLAPPYWINMGAMAISTLAGTLLCANAPHSPLLQGMQAFIKGFTIFYWVTGTWWIPMLLVLGAWRYLYKRTPLRYDPLYWGGVFPLGMYAVCTYQLVEVMALPFLAWLPQLFFYGALLAWLLTFGGMLHRVWTLRT